MFKDQIRYNCPNVVVYIVAQDSDATHRSARAIQYHAWQICSKKEDNHCFFNFFSNITRLVLEAYLLYVKFCISCPPPPPTVTHQVVWV